MKEKGKGSVGKGLLMVTQIGISMIVPIFVGAFFGYQLDRWLRTSFLFLVFLVFGILAAFRNIYKLTKPFYAEDLKREQQEQAYWEQFHRARQQGGSRPQTESAAPAGMPQSGEPKPQTESAASAGLPQSGEPKPQTESAASAGLPQDGETQPHTEPAARTGQQDAAAPDGSAQRRARQQRFARLPEDVDAVPKSRREMAEEEFAAWRRERERKQDGGADGAGKDEC